VGFFRRRQFLFFFLFLDGEDDFPLSTTRNPFTSDDLILKLSLLAKCSYVCTISGFSAFSFSFQPFFMVV